MNGASIPQFVALTCDESGAKGYADRDAFTNWSSFDVSDRLYPHPCDPDIIRQMPLWKRCGHISGAHFGGWNFGFVELRSFSQSLAYPLFLKGAGFRGKRVPIPASKPPLNSASPRPVEGHHREARLYLEARDCGA